MAAPTFIGAGSGAVWTTGAAVAVTKTSVTVGNLVIFQLVRDGTASAITLSAHSGVENLAGTDNALTDLALLQPIGSATAAAQSLYIGRAISTTVSVSMASAADDLYGRWYEFANVNVGSTLSDVIENSSAGSTVNGAGTGTTVSDTGVTTIGSDRLVLNFVGLNDDVAIDAFAGMSGGIWREAVAEYAQSTGTDAALQLQIDDDAVFAIVVPTVPSLRNVQGVGGTNEQQAASFSISGARTIRYIAANMSTTGTPADNVFVELQADSAGAPSGTALATSSVIAGGAIVGVGPVVFDLAYSLSGSTTYWLVLKRSGARDTSNHYSWRGGTADATCVSKTLDSGVWGAALAGDNAFAVCDNSAARTVDGGTDTIVSAGWGVVGFALIGTTASGPVASLLLPNRNRILVRR